VWGRLARSISTKFGHCPSPGSSKGVADARVRGVASHRSQWCQYEFIAKRAKHERTANYYIAVARIIDLCLHTWRETRSNNLNAGICLCAIAGGVMSSLLSPHSKPRHQQVRGPLMHSLVQRFEHVGIGRWMVDLSKHRTVTRLVSRTRTFALYRSLAKSSHVHDTSAFLCDNHFKLTRAQILVSINQLQSVT
jgi:hypothetical protein